MNKDLQDLFIVDEQECNKEGGFGIGKMFNGRLYPITQPMSFEEAVQLKHDLHLVNLMAEYKIIRMQNLGRN